MTPSSPRLQIGEIQAGASSGLTNARTFMLTAPRAEEHRSPEVLFGLLAADAPRKAVEKLADRLLEELRPIFFPRSGNDSPENRFEAALKQANRAVVSFLYEHRLSLAGIQLRGAIGAVAGGQLYVSNRGGVRGLLVVPEAGGFSAYDLFKEQPPKAGDPKCFTAFQAGTFAAGGRFIVMTSEACEALDASFIRQSFARPDLPRAVRELRQALRGARVPVSLLTIESETSEAGGSLTVEPQPAAARMASGADIGDLASRGIRAAGQAGAGAVSALGRGALTAAKSLAHLFSWFGAVRRKETRREWLRKTVSGPDRAASAAIERFNAIPLSGRFPLFLMLAAGAIFLHGLLFTLRQARFVGEAKAYEATLAEFERLETEFESALVVEDDGKIRETLARLNALAEGLPSDNGRRSEARKDALATVETARTRVRRSAELGPLTPFASVKNEDGRFTLATLEPMGDRLYLFSRTAPAVQIISPDGASELVELGGLPSGVEEALPMRTSFLLRAAGGRAYVWTPGSAPIAHNGSLPPGPLAFYEGRVYAIEGADVTRRNVGTRTFGTPAKAVEGGTAEAADLAVDGSVYLLRTDGRVEKYLRGQKASEFGGAPADPPTTAASDLSTDPEGQTLAFIEKGKNRLFILDKAGGRLRAQISSPNLNELSSLAVSDDGKTGWVHAGNAIYEIPLETQAP